MSKERSIDKVARYKWVCLDKPGSLLMIDKSALRIEDPQA